MKRILIVDDDANITEGLALILNEKYEVTISSNGFNAIDKLSNTSFNLILLDLQMPGLDGAGFIQEIRTRGYTTPILLITASDKAEEQSRILKVANMALKPFKLKELEEKIEMLVGK